MIKTYVLDTNVLIQTPHALESFEDNHVVLPLAVLEELDRLKNADGERGANARQAIRFLEQLRLTGNLTQGVTLSTTGGTLRLEMNHQSVPLPSGMDAEHPDNRILKVCKGLLGQGENVTLVTQDIVVRIKAQAMGIPSEGFTTEQISLCTQRYTGRADVFIPEEHISTFKKKGIESGALYAIDENTQSIPVHLTENQFVILHVDTSSKKTLLGRYHDGKVTALIHSSAHPFGIKARNVGQKFLQEALMLEAKKAPLVIVQGPAGTAKTFYTLAVGLEKVLEQSRQEYRKILICRPNAQFDQEIGFLPGSEQDKISPLLRPIVDNLEILLAHEDDRSQKSEDELKSRIEYLFEAGIIRAEAMNFMRGRSITDTFLIIDEAQNLTPRQVKGIITRVGRGTKVVLLGDPAQIDHPLLSERTNGLSYAAQQMKGSPLCVQLAMSPDECERSDLALDAAARM